MKRRGLFFIFFSIILLIFSGCSQGTDGKEENKYTVETPTFSIPSCGIDTEIKVSISCETKTADIYYTINGDTPNKSSILYTEEITVCPGMTLKAIAVRENYNDSSIAIAEYLPSSKANYTFTEEIIMCPEGTDGTAGPEWTYLYFGDFPQTVAKSDIICNYKAEENGYYVGSDGNYYAKVIINFNNTDSGNTDFSDGSDVPYRATKYFKVEPIKWRVLTNNYNNTNNSLIVAENCISTDVPIYSGTHPNGSYGSNYQHSEMRAYLNGISFDASNQNDVNKWLDKGFLQSAFTESAREKIKNTVVKNDAESTADERGMLTKADNFTCEDTTDKIFLLSEREVTTKSYGFASYNVEDSVRVKIPTDYAIANGISFLRLNKWGSAWLLRSPDYQFSRVRYVSREGNADNAMSTAVTFDGIVPAFTIELDGPTKNGSSSADNDKVSTPTFSINSGEVVSGTKVAINCSTPDAKIYYTTNGTTTFSSAILYTDEIIITKAMTINAIAKKSGKKDSEIASATYTVQYPSSYQFTETVMPCEKGTKGSGGTEATYVYFGDWPKSLAKSGVSFSNSPSDNGYYVGSDGNYYAKCLENAADSGYYYSDGITLIEKANKNVYRYFKVEPIKWRVVDSNYDIDGDKGSENAKLLVAEDILLSNIPFFSSTNMRSVDSNKTVYPNNYQYSEIRAYLNGTAFYDSSNIAVTNYKDKGFLQNAFTSNAQALIRETTVMNDGASTITSSGNFYPADGSNGFFPVNYTCSPTIDKIFLLSEYEITKYSKESYSSYGQNNSRIRMATDYAMASGVSKSNKSNEWWCGSSWLLRSPSYSSGGEIHIVSMNGDNSGLMPCTSATLGVVPALAVSF